MAWSAEESAELYGVPYWGRGLFQISERGTLVMTPAGPGRGEVDLQTLAEQLVERGVDLPVLVRAPQVAQRRVELLQSAFASARESFSYEGAYRAVYPIKCNQQRHLVEEILRVGRPFHVGLEAGSKAELLLALALVEDDDSPILCNGYKDRRYVEIALTAQQLGRTVVIVVEKLSELDLILSVADELGVEPMLGVRAKLSQPGKGRWKGSAGDRAKFGLSALAIVSLVERLRERDRLGWLRLLHFHIGSQVTAIRTFKTALREATRLYVELVRLGAPMGYFDVGGGLGVDYDGSQTAYESSRNYTVAEYAADVVSHIQSACEGADIPHPDIVTESGRATTAHCSVLLFDILGVEAVPTEGVPETPGPDDSELLVELHEVYAGLSVRNLQEAWHDAVDVRSRSRSAFELGVIDLSSMARVDAVFWKTAGRILRMTKEMPYIPEELVSLQHRLADTYYGNFSVFQSAPDAWAVDQLFPCLPVSRLCEEPVRRAVIADLTCDSDGKLARFVDRRDVKKALEVHPVNAGERYVLALALVGAYQEILGDLHNLFGDTHAVHVFVDEAGAPRIDRVIEGDRVEDVARYVQYDRKDLVHRVRRATERAIAEGRLTATAAKRVLSLYRSSLDGYTYLGR